VETALQRADQLVLRFRIEGVPTFVVNGKYVADVRSAGSPERLLSPGGRPRDPRTQTLSGRARGQALQVDATAAGPVRSDGARALEVSDCNCSMCGKSGFLHLIVPADQFVLVSGRGDLTTYTFNTGVAKHTFALIAALKSFYTPRSHPDGVSVNARCIDSETVESMSITPFDGRHWESARPSLRGPDKT